VVIDQNTAKGHHVLVFSIKTEKEVEMNLQHVSAENRRFRREYCHRTNKERSRPLKKGG
jgi:hypothetical protein